MQLLTVDPMELLKSGDTIPNPYRFGDWWEIVSIEGEDVTIHWTNGNDTLGSLHGPALMLAMSHAINYADVWQAGRLA